MSLLISIFYKIFLQHAAILPCKENQMLRFPVPLYDIFLSRHSANGAKVGNLFYALMRNFMAWQFSS